MHTTLFYYKYCDIFRPSNHSQGHTYIHTHSLTHTHTHTHTHMFMICKLHFLVTLRPSADYSLLIREVFRSYTTTHHNRQDSSVRVISSSQIPLPDNTQYTKETDLHAPPVRFEPTISAGERPQTYALDRAATGNLYRQYRFSLRGVTLTPHPLLVPWSRKSRAIRLLPLWAVRSVQSLSACKTVHFTFTYTSTLPMNRTACTDPQCLYRVYFYIVLAYNK